MFVDLNHESDFVYGCASLHATSDRVNALIDEAPVARRHNEPPRNYLGASRIGEPCS